METGAEFPAGVVAGSSDGVSGESAAVASKPVYDGQPDEFPMGQLGVNEKIWLFSPEGAGCYLIT